MTRHRDPMGVIDPIDLATGVALAIALIATITMAALKLAGLIALGWGWVLFPILMLIAGLFLAFIVMIIIAFLEDDMDHDDVDWMQ